MSDISTIIENKYSYSIPGWCDFTALNTLAELDWVEKKGRGYADEYEGNANNLSYTASDKSTATYVSKITYDKTYDYYYPSSVSFSLKGADKTSLTVTEKHGNSGSTVSIAYSAGLGTKDYTDDVTFTDSYTSAYTSTSTTYSGKTSYKDGLGNNLNVSNSYSKKMNNAGTSGTYSDTYTLSATDASKNKMSGGFVITGTVDDSYNETPTSTTISAGSATLYDDADSITTSWTKVTLSDASIDSYSLFGSESTDFPLASLIDAFSPYVMESANTITISSPSGTGMSIDAGAGNDTVTGGIGDYSIIGGSGSDKITGSSGNDIIHGDILHIDETYSDVKGKDTLIGGDGNDQLDGGYGDDSLTGGNGNDLLYGAGGTDIMSGDAGDDILVAYGSKDQLTGGAGSDKFVFYNWDSTAMTATVKDFKSGTDFLDVECWSNSIDDVVVMDSTNFLSGKGMKSSTNDSVFVYDTSTGNLYFDDDGSGSGKGVLIVTLTGKPTLSTNYFTTVDLSGYDLFS